MLRSLTAAAIAGASLFAGAAPAGQPEAAANSALFDDRRAVALRRFSSAEDFERFLAEQRARRARMIQGSNAAGEVASDEEFTLSGAVNVEQVINTLPQVLPAGDANPEITNNQTAGVDEGGIVKQVGRFLIILQDGRLFSADLGAGEGVPLRLADRIDVYRSRETAASWYDEMLVLGNRILVTAYSYEEHASEISVFTLDDNGRVAREGRWLISSEDYYSAENYATRLVGDNLVFYAPHSLWRFHEEGPQRWPRLRRAPVDGAPDEGTALIGPTEVYAPLGEAAYPVIHTLSVCPLRGGMECRTTAFIGPPTREVYVSPTDAFLWLGAPDGLPWSIDYANARRRTCPGGAHAAEPGEDAAMLYRVPLDGGGIGAAAVDGLPEDQFAFDSRSGRFRALLARPDGECRKWDAPEPLFLLDIPLSAFGQEVRRVSAVAYTPLPRIDEGTLENRFVGDWLIYGGRTSWSGLDEEGEDADGEEHRTASTLWTVPLARPTAPVRIALPHNALRIERAGRDAVVTGYSSGDGLSMSYVTIGSAPRLASTTFLPGRFESEGRSHAFGALLRRDGSALLALPTSRRERAGRGWSNSRSSDLTYVAVSPGKSVVPAGQLSPAPGRPRRSGYRCEVSCVDWYGNSRPIFTGGRIFALMGTDLVEGRMEGGWIAETGRVDLTAPPLLSRR